MPPPPSAGGWRGGPAAGGLTETDVFNDVRYNHNRITNRHNRALSITNISPTTNVINRTQLNYPQTTNSLENHVLPAGDVQQFSAKGCANDGSS